MKKAYIIPASRVHHFTTTGIIAQSLPIYMGSEESEEKEADDSEQLVREEFHWYNDNYKSLW